MRPSTGATQDYFCRHGEAGESWREDREGRSVIGPKHAQPVYWQASDVDVFELIECRRWLVQGRVKRGTRERLKHRKDDALCAPPLGQIVMNDRDFMAHHNSSRSILSTDLAKRRKDRTFHARPADHRIDAYSIMGATVTMHRIPDNGQPLFVATTATLSNGP
jgi:hypothetical protein